MFRSRSDELINQQVKIRLTEIEANRRGSKRRIILTSPRLTSLVGYFHAPHDGSFTLAAYVPTRYGTTWLAYLAADGDPDKAVSYRVRKVIFKCS